MWANAQRNGRPTEYTAEFGWRPLLECRGVTLPRCETRHFGTIAQLCRAISSELKHVSTIGKKACFSMFYVHVTRLLIIVFHGLQACYWTEINLKKNPDTPVTWSDGADPVCLLSITMRSRDVRDVTPGCRARVRSIKHRPHTINTWPGDRLTPPSRQCPVTRDCVRCCRLRQMSRCRSGRDVTDSTFAFMWLRFTDCCMRFTSHSPSLAW